MLRGFSGQAAPARAAGGYPPTLLAARSSHAAAALQGARLEALQLKILGFQEGPPEGRAGAYGSPRAGTEHAVVAFLKAAGLPQFAETFLRTGFDEMETVRDMEDVDMKDLGMGPDHIAKLKTCLNLRRQYSGTACSPRVDPNHPVVNFLRNAGLLQHAGSFMQQGFDELETLADINEADLEDLGLSEIHRVQLKTKLKELSQKPIRAVIPKLPVAANCSGDLMRRSSAPVAPSGPLSKRPAHLSSSHDQSSAVPFQAAKLADSKASPRQARSPAARVAPQREPTEDAKTAVQHTWEQVQAMGMHTLEQVLYRHTFELFPPEAPVVAKHFGKAVVVVGESVAGLRDIGKLVPRLREMGARHINYAVADEYWPILGTALNRTLAMLLEDAFTQEVEAAWTEVYSFVSLVMLQGMEEARLAGKAPGQARTEERQLALAPDPLGSLGALDGSAGGPLRGGGAELAAPGLQAPRGVLGAAQSGSRPRPAAAISSLCCPARGPMPRGPAPNRVAAAGPPAPPPCRPVADLARASVAAATLRRPNAAL